MSYGLMSTNNLVTSDLVAPGMPTFVSIVQESNTIIRLTIAIPVMDADGGNLTGLTKMTVVSLPQVDGTNPFEGIGMPEALVITGVAKFDVTLEPADAGTEKTVDVTVMNLGGAQAFGVACADD